MRSTTIKDELKERIEFFVTAGKLVEAQRIEQRTRFDMEMLNELGFCKGIENYTRHISGALPGEPPPTLVDYLPPDALMIIDESHVTIPQLGGMYRGDRVPQGDAGRVRFPAALGARQPAAALRRVRTQDAPLRLRVGHAGRLRTASTRRRWSSRWSGRPAWSTRRSRSGRRARRSTTCCRKSLLRVARSERVLITTLTKRMAEDLTEFLSEHGVKVRYLHSDVDTVERVEIIRDLRAGTFDVLVGINLLREGLDLPEVSLVAILDADKEGFLRSERSLIQTIGRAARNLNGTAILYADADTDSMRRALDETERRRAKQRRVQPRARHRCRAAWSRKCAR